jgi:hypothetical protein
MTLIDLFGSTESHHSKSRITGALLLCIILSVATAAVFFVMLFVKVEWPRIVGPLLLTMSILAWVTPLYAWQRKVTFQRRERRRKEDPAEILTIPDGLKKPEHYDGGRALHEGQWLYINRAVEAQGSYFANGILGAILPPLALCLLSLQILVWPEGGPWARGLILCELLCLGVLVYFALINREPTSDWIANRVRTELLRREQYLLLARVGPYLAKDDLEAVQEALRRKSQIEAADPQVLLALIPLEDPSGLSWLEILHRTFPQPPVRPDFIERMDSYFYYRIGKQLLWFANELRDCEENERFWSRLLTGALLAAIVAAALHFAHLNGLNGEIRTPDASSIWSNLIGVLAIVLPPLGTASLSIKAMYNFRGRARIYTHERNSLLRQKGDLESLLLKAKQMRVEGSARINADEADVSFRVLVLRTEQSLSIEMQQWMLLMERKEFEVSP